MKSVIRFTAVFICVLFTMPALAAYTLIAPNGGEQWRAITSKKITWSTSNTGTVKLEYQSSAGGAWTLIATGIPADTLCYNWTVPSIESAACLLRITDLADELDADVSDLVFTITQVIPTTEVEPNNTADIGNWMEYGDSLYASIAPLGDVDYYRFWGAEDDTIEIWGHERNNSGLGGRIFLYQADGTTLFTNNGYLNPPYDQRIALILPQDGFYYIRYSQSSDWGSYPNRELVERLENDYWEDIGSDPVIIQWEMIGDYTVGVKRLAPGGPAIISTSGWDYWWNSVRFRGEINTGGMNTTVQFEYGLTTDYGSIVPAEGGPFNSIAPIYVESPIVDGLQPERFYYMRMQATNALGSTISGNRQFSTVPAPEGWERKISEMKRDFNDVFFIDDNTGIIVGDSIIIRTADGGDTWTAVYSGGSRINFNGVFFATTNEGFAIGSYGNVYKTTDAGLTWAPIKISTGQYLFAGFFVNTQSGWIIGDNGTIIHTSDGGENWTLQNSGTGSNLRGIHFFDENVGMVVGLDNTILRTTDGGSTWIPITGSWSGSHNAIHFADALVGIVVGNNDFVLRTADGGLTWHQIDLNIDPYRELTDVHFYMEGYGIAVGSMGRILRTTDGGLTWNIQQSGTRNNLYALHTAGTHSMIIGRNNAILRSTDFLSLKSPSGGEVWEPGSTQNVVWWTDLAGEVRLEYRTGANNDWIIIVASTSAAAGNYSWIVPFIRSDSCKVRITSLLAGAVMDESDAVFSIKSATTQQSIVLKAGWNMISTYLIPDVLSVETVMTDLVASGHLIIMKNNEGDVYWPELGWNGIGDWEPFQGYQCFLTGADELLVNGQQQVPELTPISLPAGWNMIAYLRDNPYDAAAALTSITSSLIIAKNGNGDVYWPELGWNGIGEMLPGQGYQIYLNQAATLTYPANGAISSKTVALADIQVQPLNHFQLSHWLTGSNATLLARASFLQDNDEIAICDAEGNVFGAAVVRDGRAMITIWGDDSQTPAIDGAREGEKLNLIHWTNTGEEEISAQISALQDGVSGLVLGTGFAFSKDAVMIADLSEIQTLPKYYALRQNYPNPFNPATGLRYELPKDSQVLLVIYNLHGQVIRTLVEAERKAGFHKVTWDGRNQAGAAVASGIYLARLEAGAVVKVIKMSFVK